MKRNGTKTILASVFLVAATSAAIGQSPFDRPNTNMFIQNQAVSPIVRPSDGMWDAKGRKGDPGKIVYQFSDTYLDAIFYGPNGKPVPGKKFKLNLKTSGLFFLDENGEEQEVISPVKKIEFLPHDDNSSSVTFEKGFIPAENTFFQVLVPGKASLLLDTKFVDVEEYVYGGANTMRTDRLTSFYGTTGTTAAKLAKPEDVILLLSDKSKDITEYMKKENTKVKKQADLEKVFMYYNSLFK